MNPIHSQALLASLKAAPLLVDDLAQVASLDRALLGAPHLGDTLDEQQKLGHLYEDALLVLLQRSNDFELLADHVQVFNSDQVTLGEMDYILRDRVTQQTIHLELAVKFYLGLPTLEGWQFPGPDPKDNWLRKLQRMQSHQFTLAHRPETRALLLERWGIEQVEVQQLIYGCLFYPMEAEEQPLPVGVRADCRKGRWLYQRDWSRLMGQVDAVHIVPKSLWPVEMTAALRATLPSVSVETLQGAATQRCVMFVLPDSSAPYFLVPDDWPERIC